MVVTPAPGAVTEGADAAEPATDSAAFEPAADEDDDDDDGKGDKDDSVAANCRPAPRAKPTAPGETVFWRFDKGWKANFTEVIWPPMYRPAAVPADKTVKTE